MKLNWGYIVRDYEDVVERESEVELGRYKERLCGCSEQRNKGEMVR